jgi:hypothetical protein
MTGRYLTPLHGDILDDNDVELLAVFLYYSAILAQVIVIPKGFVTDFASVPRAPGAFWLLGGRCKWEAVIHDYLYRVLKLGRRTADNVFLEAMSTPRKRTRDGVVTEWSQPRWVRAAMWTGVRVGGGFSYTEKPGETITKPDQSPGA